MMELHLPYSIKFLSKDSIKWIIQSYVISNPQCHKDMQRVII